MCVCVASNSNENAKIHMNVELLQALSKTQAALWLRYVNERFQSKATYNEWNVWKYSKVI